MRVVKLALLSADASLSHEKMRCGILITAIAGQLRFIVIDQSNRLLDCCETGVLKG